MRITEKLLQDISTALDALAEITEKGENIFLANSSLQAIAYWNLIVIGEASNILSDDFKKQYPSIDWRDIIGLRNILIHQYFNIELEQIWQTISINAPELRRRLLEP